MLIPEHVTGLPVLRALSLCTCCRHYPGAADGLQTSLKLAHPYQPSPKWVSGRPAHRPFRGLLSVHSRCGLHTRTVTYVTVIRGLQTFRHLHACPGCFRREQFAGWDLHPLENAAFARRTPQVDVQAAFPASQLLPFIHVSDGVRRPWPLPMLNGEIWGQSRHTTEPLRRAALADSRHSQEALSLAAHVQT